MPDVLSPSQRSYCMSRIQANNTRPELVLRKALWAHGFRYRLKNKFPGRPDLFFSSRKLVVFIDGCFWHNCPLHCQVPQTNQLFWQKKLSKNKERDEKVRRTLESEGWRVLRIWEHEIKNDLPGCINRVLKAFKDAGG